MSLNEVDISIIMPVYNAEKYLSQALQSIRCQTYKNFELICINDASTDRTMEVLQKFRNIDSRIKIMENQERFGAAIARNRGMLEARGKYLVFLDADDIFEEEMLESSYKEMERYNVDIVMYEFMHVPSAHIYEKRRIPRSEQFIERYCRTPFSICEYEPIEFLNWTPAPWNKMYRKDFIFFNQLEFQTLSSSNDVYFGNMALLLAEKVIMLEDRRVMVYVRDHYEPTRISYNRDPMCAYLAMEKLGKELVIRGLFNDLFQYYYFRLFETLRAALAKTKRQEDAKQFYNFLQKEGISNFAGISAECYQRVDAYIYNLLEKFRRTDFSTGWYNQEHASGFYLYKNTDKIISLFHFFKESGKKVAWWGAGVRGGACLNFLQQHGLQVSAVVDKNENKSGKMISGYVIKKPEEVLATVQVVMVCTLAVYEEVLVELEGMDIEVINIEDYCR